MPPDILTMYAQGQPDKPAVIDDRPNGQLLQWSYADLNAQANRLANVLSELGVGRGTRVVWCGQSSAPVLAMTHASRKIGSTAVPLNYRLSPDEAAYVTDNSDAALVFVDAEFASLFEKIRGDIPKVEHILVFDGAVPNGMTDADAAMAAASTDEPDVGETAEVPATMIYTSGTTGKPKGALRRGSGDPTQVQAMLAHIGYRPDDIYLTTGPLYHSGPGGFAGIAAALGNTVIVQRKFDPEDWLRLVDKYKATSTFSAPTPIRLICNVPAEVKAKYDRSSMRVMIANAAPWSFALKKQYVDDFPPESLWEVYGSTELGVDTILAPADQMRKPGSCGLPAPGVELALFDEQGKQITEPNVPGELYVRSKSVFTTYYKADDKYEEDTRGDYHTVGNVAYRDEEGYYYIADRKKDMIISGGMNIYPAEIEGALEQHPQIFDVAVFGVPSEEWGESVHAVVVTQPAGALTEADVITFAREH